MENKKMNAINEYVKAMIDNKDVREIYLKNEKNLKGITPIEVFNIKYWNEEFNISDNEIKKVAGKLVNTFTKGLENYNWKIKNDSKLFKLLLEEGRIIRNKFDDIKTVLKDNKLIDIKIDLFEKFSSFVEIEKRFLKMQNIIFPRLEQKLTNSRPLSIMWSLHDDSVGLLKEIITNLHSYDEKQMSTIIGKYFFLTLGIIQKEELLVLPNACYLLDLNEWNEMYDEAFDYGYSFMSVKKNLKSNENYEEDFLIKTNTGSMTLEEMVQIFKKIGVDFTFVDADNKVKFFNNTEDRIFPRSPSIIGRNVENCHPPKSLHIVNTIIDNFRNNIKDEARFHIKIKERFLCISYFAIRSKDGKYLGVLEVTQDVTNIRSLEGEKRLLDWKE